MSRALEYIVAAQNADGGWGYKPGGMSFVEPTAAVMLALFKDAENDPTVQRARASLTSLQHPDGGWGIAASDETSGWMTAWATRALNGSDAAARGKAWLLAQSGLRVTDPEQIAGVQKALHIDARVTGWAWQPGDAAWIFPTALALLALHTSHAQHPRVLEAIQYLLDRSIPEGGWNIGNPFMVTGTLPPTVENTSLALLALDALNVQAEEVERARAWLARENFIPTAFEWAWRGWYWTTRGEDAARAQTALKESQRGDGSWDGNPFTTAIAMLAGGGE